MDDTTTKRRRVSDEWVEECSEESDQGEVSNDAVRTRRDRWRDLRGGRGHSTQMCEGGDGIR